MIAFSDWFENIGQLTTPWEKNIQNKIINYVYVKSEATHKFCKKQLAITIYEINKMEDVIPQNVREDIIVEKIDGFLNGTLDEPDDIPWNSEGSLLTIERQLYQFSMAAKYLLIENLNSILTPRLIIQTHNIMMNGSFQKDINDKLIVGRFRTRNEEVYAEYHQFVKGCDVQFLMQKCCDTYYTKNPISKAIKLFYDILSIHPFHNGNGRLCRLLLVWSLMKDGFPFAFNFSSGKKKAKQHYIQAIKRARRNDSSHLFCILILSLHNVIIEYNKITQKVEI
jgi:fido (protein-threonine AMPylation protein)